MSRIGGGSWAWGEPVGAFQDLTTSGKRGLHAKIQLVVRLGLLRLRRLLEGLRRRRHLDLSALEQAVNRQNLDASILLIPAGER